MTRTARTALMLSCLAPLLLPLLAPATARADADLLVARALGDDLTADPVALAATPRGLVVAGASLQTWSPAADLLTDRDGRVTDLAAAGDGLAVLGHDDLVRLDADGAVTWTAAARGATRVAGGTAGSVAVLAGDELRTYTADGRLRARWTVPAELAALAVDDASDLVLATGHRTIDCDGEPRDVPVLAAWSLAGAARWAAYDHAAAALCAAGPIYGAAARGVDVALGGDGHVYFLAAADGPETVLRDHPRHLGVRAANEIHDGLTDPEEAQRGTLAYYARFDRGGEHLAGQFLGLPATDSEPSRLDPRAIAATVDGVVVVAGATNRTFDGADERPGTEALGQSIAFVLVVEPDLDGRRRHDLLEDLAGAHAVVDLAVTRDSVVALVVGAEADALVELPLGEPPPDAEGKKKVTKHPDNDTQATFGFESGVSGSDPTCYCDAPRLPGPAALLTLGLLPLALRRPRRR